ncbi:hypothetical protein BU204_20805 [Actinophytocola xanthii]|uniref:8-oxo-dGTP diphosphatase n=1 Tax=Actinophytocola xanthii TaxID=1912961 RepID=A0A1Q8CMX2_9PSEU|nr:hypothetical protein BU204_20805 [Actinophytocola xanthii]
MRQTVLVDAPARAVSAALTERALFGGTGVLAPGDELPVLLARLRVAESSVDELRLVPVGGWGLSLSLRLAPTGAGVLVTCTASWRRPGMAARRPVLALLGSLVETVRERAVALAGADLVVGAAIVRGGALLAQQRAYPAAAAGRWELPGGRVEPGEAPVAALARECVEELGVEIQVGEPVGPDVVVPGGAVLRVHGATLADPAATPHPFDHHALRWLTAGELGTVDWLPADRVLVPALRRLLRAPEHG